VLVDAPFEGQVAGFFQNRVIRQIDPQGVLQQFWDSGLPDRSRRLCANAGVSK
jgi:hypothetical protein